jgi:hypothetical protein
MGHRIKLAEEEGRKKEKGEEKKARKTIEKRVQT